MSKPVNKTKLQTLSQADKLSLIAIDEAHLITEWKEFRSAYSCLTELKSDYTSVPIMALTATASPLVEEDIKLLLRNPVIKKASVNRPNITLNVEEIIPDKSTPYPLQFATRVAQIIGSQHTIVYTDFIADVGPIISGFAEVGIEAVGYHGEMDPTSRHESYLKWTSGQVQVVVATKAFGLGINKADIRHVIRNGVPESMLSWAQELGRAGRDGCQATATILFKQSDISHANAWVLNNLSNKERCEHILRDFSMSWRYVQSHLAGICRREILLQIFGETDSKPYASGDCCDVCVQNNNQQYKLTDHKEELRILNDALQQIGSKGELKVSEWIRGSKIPWTNSFNKECLSYGNHRGRDISYWRRFMRQCHVLSLIQYELKSIIKKNGHYAVNGIYQVAEKGREVAEGNEQLLLPDMHVHVKTCAQTSNSVVDYASVEPLKRARIGKGSNILSVVRSLLSQPENWMEVDSKLTYQFPGVFSKPVLQQLYFTCDVSRHAQSCEDLHFIWKDIQLSKGQLNKDRLINVQINGKDEKLYYRSSPCSGIKFCPVPKCCHVVPMRDKRNCPVHNVLLQKATNCPVEFVYLYPEDESDKRRWFGGLTRCQKNPTDNLHNHRIHGASKISQCVREKIGIAISNNPSLTPTDVACGKGLGFIPSAVDGASSHSGKIAHEIRKTKQKKGIREKDWCPMSFEQVADCIDEDDNHLTDDTDKTVSKYMKYGRPYLVSSGYEDGVKYIFTMSPVMTQVLSEAEFIQCDITYDECTDYPYIFNVVAFNKVTMDWMVVGRLRLNMQTADAYALAFKKIFLHCSNKRQSFQVGKTLLGVITDWSDAEINGLKLAVGKNMAEQLVRGCTVHWQHSCQRIAERVSSHTDKQRERSVFLKIANRITKLESSIDVVACFEALCSVRTVNSLLIKLPSLCCKNDADFVDHECDWSMAKNWAQWWTKCSHLRMLSAAFTAMDKDVWSRCPSTTNAVERKNKDCKSDSPNCLKAAMIKVYKVDKVTCLKHIAAEEGSTLSYHSKTEEARRQAAHKKQKQRKACIPDKSAQFGPPDRPSNYLPMTASSRKRKSFQSTGNCAPKKRAVTVSGYTPNSNPEVLGKSVKMKFNIENGKEEWFEGVICSYNGMTQKYGVYFPCDGQTVETSLDDEDMEICN